MSNKELQALGHRIAELRIARQLKQTELAYEAGVSHRTLQRLEAGEPIKSDGLMQVIRCLGRLDTVLGALESQGFSPYEKLAEAGLKVSELKPQRPGAAFSPAARAGAMPATSHKRRVRRARTQTARNQKPADHITGTVTVQWPEDLQ
jgi:transcriptional regulator with XRE-family HTH domain